MYRPEFMMYSDESADDEELSPNKISDDVSSDSDGGKRRQRHREGEDSEDDGDYMMSDESDEDDQEVQNIRRLANGDQLVRDASAKYPLTLLSSLNDLQDCKLFCDVRIKVGTETFDAHKAVLAAASGFFRTMFTSEFKEKNQDEVTIDGESDIFKPLLASIYTGKLVVSEATLAETFNMALLMQLNHVFPLILSYLKDQHQTPKTCRFALTTVFQVSMLASRGSYQNDCLNEIKELCYERIRKEWELFTKMDGFLQDVTVDFLEDILDQGRFFCGECEILETIVLWLKHDWEKRQTHAACLLRRIRLGLVKRDDLKKLIDDQIVEIPDCHSLLMEALRIHDLADEEAAERETDFQKYSGRGNKLAWFMRRIGLYQPFQERFPDMCSSRTTVKVLISTGGKRNKKSGASYFMLDDKSKDQGWIDYKRFSKKLAFDNFRDHSTIVVNGRIYIIGGTEIKQWPKVRRVCTNYVWYYDMNPDVLPGWRTPHPQMKVARRKSALAYLKPHLYVIGGLDNTGMINSVERFAIADYEWETLPALPRRCQYMSVIVCNKMLIVYGCFHKPLRWKREKEKYTIQILDTESKKWYGAGFTEEHSPETEIKPAIMEHEGEYYRIIFNNASQSSAAETQNDGNGDRGDKWKYSADHNDKLVQKLIQELKGDKFIAKIGETVDQSCIPKNQSGAFRIADDIFVNVNGFIHKTGMKVSSFADGKVDLGRWQNVNSFDPKFISRSDIRDSITCLTYDTRIPQKEDWRM